MLFVYFLFRQSFTHGPSWNCSSIGISIVIIHFMDKVDTIICLTNMSKAKIGFNINGFVKHNFVCFPIYFVGQQVVRISTGKNFERFAA